MTFTHPDNELARLRDDNAQLREALDLLRPAHHTPYEDEEHQGSNCVDLTMTLLGRAYRPELTLRAIREWCDRTASAASMSQSEPVFQARMQLVDEVRALLPAVPAVKEDKP